MFNWKKMLVLCTLALVLTVAFTDVASADVMATALNKVNNVFQKTRKIVFVLGAFGLIGLAFQAIFGKVKWSWFAGLAVGLAIVAAAQAVVQYAAGQSQDGMTVTDTFDEN
jgi:type IV secretory pathway VirB2 component (pilin)